MFYLMTHSTHFIYGYMASDIWKTTIQIARVETRCRHMGCSFRLAARVLLYAPSHRQDNTYHDLCYTSRGTLAGTRNNSNGPPWRIDPMTHHTMSERSYHGATSRSLLHPGFEYGWPYSPVRGCCSSRAGLYTQTDSRQPASASHRGGTASPWWA